MLPLLLLPDLKVSPVCPDVATVKSSASECPSVVVPTSTLLKNVPIPRQVNPPPTICTPFSARILLENVATPTQVNPPPTIFTPLCVVIIPTESIFVTSSYVTVQPTERLPPTYKLLPIPTPPLTTNAPVEVDDDA